MTIYLAIITTVLVITQIIRVVQNTINLYRNNKVFDAQLKQLGEVTNEDLETQKEAYRLAVKYFKDKSTPYKDSPDPLWCEDCKHFCNYDLFADGKCELDGHDTWYGRPICKNAELKGNNK